jgi:hypothetical protein
LTIPFLLGARAIIEPQKPVLNVAEFLCEASQQLPGTILMRCGHIGEYVIADLDADSATHCHLFKAFGHLFITDESFVGVKDLSILIGELTDLYADCLQKKYYSKVDKNWTPFTDLDRSRLAEIRDRP